MTLFKVGDEVMSPEGDKFGHVVSEYKSYGKKGFLAVIHNEHNSTAWSINANGYDLTWGEVQRVVAKQEKRYTNLYSDRSLGIPFPDRASTNGIIGNYGRTRIGVIEFDYDPITNTHANPKLLPIE